MAGRTEIEKEFTPSTLGNRVGWSEVREYANEAGEFIGINVTTATVSDKDGAKFGYNFVKRTSDGVESLPFPFHQGLSAVTAFSVFVPKEDTGDRRFEMNYEYSAADSHHQRDHHLQYGVLHRPEKYEQSRTEKVWATNASELLGTLRQQLEDASVPDAYNLMYLWMNGAVARGRGDLTVNVDGFEEASLLMPDPSMNEVTQRQIKALEAVNDSYEASIANDILMTRRLSVFSDISASGIADEFTLSRERAALFEAGTRNRVGGLAIQRFGYVPTGHGPHARSWPYMEAKSNADGTAYGIELQALRSENTAFAEYELTRETKELFGRRQIAVESLRRFTLLHSLEIATQA